MKHILTIAGSDSIGGAGIQGDLKTIGSHGLHGLSVITAVTAQNSTSVTSVYGVDNVWEQCLALAEDTPIHSVKIGMLYTLKNVKDIIRFIKKYLLVKKIPIVLDPIIFSTTGRQLIEDEALKLVVNELIPYMNLITPNQREAEFLADKKGLDQLSLAKLIYERFKVPVLVKGGHFLLTDAKKCLDILYDGICVNDFIHQRIESQHTHGTGCCLSTAIACQLGLGRELEEGVFWGTNFVTMAIKNGYKVGKGDGIVDPLIHFITNYVTMNDVANCCLASGGRPIMAEEVSEMKEIIPMNNGLVINLGTMNQERLHLMNVALDYIDVKSQCVLLDPVGCASSGFRRSAAIHLIKSGKIKVLKLNTQEGIALLNYNKLGEENNLNDIAYGVDSEDVELEAKRALGLCLYNTFSNYNKELIVVVTGKIDIVVSINGIKEVIGGNCMQQRITGTGCMLNGMIVTNLARNKSSNPVGQVVKALMLMNKASERAAKKLIHKRDLITYKQLLIDEISRAKKSVYLITDEKIEFNKLMIKTELALSKGVDILQYRVKLKNYEEMVEEGSKLRELTLTYGVTFLINDNIRLAKDVKADGVHLGYEDESIKVAKQLLGADAIIGATAKTLEQAFQAEKDGATYLGVGAIYSSPTKPNAIPVTFNILKDICKKVSIPVYAIGGLNIHNIDDNLLEYVSGIAVVSGIYQNDKEGIEKLIKLIK